MSRHALRIFLVVLLFVAFFIFHELNNIWYTTESGSTEEAQVQAWIDFFTYVVVADVIVLSVWMIYEDVKAMTDG